MSKQEQPTPPKSGGSQQRKPNPLLEQQDPYAEYRKQMAANPEMQEDSRLAYSTFVSHADGKKLMDKMKERYFMSTLIDPTKDSAPTNSLYWEGFRDCIRTLNRLADSHKQSIQALGGKA